MLMNLDLSTIGMMNQKEERSPFGGNEAEDL